MDSMTITVERMHRLTAGTSTKAFADVRFFNALTVKGFRVVEKKDGTLFVGAPQTQSKKNSRWYNDVQMEKHLDIAVEDAVIKAYQVTEQNKVKSEGRA